MAKYWQNGRKTIICNHNVLNLQQHIMSSTTNFKITATTKVSTINFKKIETLPIEILNKSL